MLLPSRLVTVTLTTTTLAVLVNVAICCELNWVASRAAVTTINQVFQNRNLITISKVRMAEAAVGRP